MTNDELTVVGEHYEQVITVLREHLAFVKEQLASKETWLQHDLERSREQAVKIWEENQSLGEDCEELRVALAEAISEVQFHNQDSDSTYETRQEDINEWILLTQTRRRSGMAK